MERLNSHYTWLAGELKYEYPDPRELALCYWDLSAEAAEKQNDITCQGGTETCEEERERQAWFQAFEGMGDDYEYSAALMEALMASDTCDDALLVIDVYLASEQWDIEQAAGLLRRWFTPTNSLSRQHARMLAAGAVHSFAGAQMKRYGPDLGKFRARARIMQAGLPIECIDDPSAFWHGMPPFTVRRIHPRQQQ